MEEYYDDIDGPNQDIYDPITGSLIAKKTVRKKAKNRTYLDLRSKDGLKSVVNYPEPDPQPVYRDTASSVQNQSNAMLRGRQYINQAPLLSGGGTNDNIPVNLQNYMQQQQEPVNHDAYYSVPSGASNDDIYQQIKQILFSMTNSNHLSNVGIVGAREPATNDMGQKVDMLIGGQRPDSTELLTAGVDLNLPASSDQRYTLLNDTMKRIFNGFTDISGVLPQDVSTTTGLSPFTENGLTADVIPSGTQMVKTWKTGRTHSFGKQRYKPIPLVFIKVHILARVTTEWIQLSQHIS